MKQPIKLYFDKVLDNGLRGVTVDLSKIYYNLKQIDLEWFDKFTNMLSDDDMADLMLPTGRFLSLIEMTLNEGERGMVTMDLLNNESLAKRASLEQETQEDRNRFMYAFSIISENYEKYYNKFVLVEGLPPELDNNSANSSDIK